MHLDEMVSEIKNDKVSGAKELVKKTLDYMKEGLRIAESFDQYINFVRALGESRPSMAPLINVSDVMEKILLKRKSLNVSHEIDLLREYLRNSSKRLVENAISKIFKEKINIMTISRSSTVIETLIEAKKQGSLGAVYILESKPLGEGLKTAVELSKSKIKVVLIPDLAFAFYIKNVDAVIVGADAILKGGFINKIGTYPLAEAAKRSNVSFFVVADTFKIDLKNEQYPIEFGKKEDLCGDQCPNVDIRVPYFEITPNNLASYFITENGSYKPDELKLAIEKRNKFLNTIWER